MERRTPRPPVLNIWARAISPRLSSCHQRSVDSFTLKRKILLSWSSGKDSAWTLPVLRQRGEVDVVGLLTTINTHFQRVAMHGTRQTLLKAQADAVRLPLWEVPLPWPCSNENYKQAMSTACATALRQGISAVAFGDLFL